MMSIGFFNSFYAALKRMLPWIIITVFFRLFVTVFLNPQAFFLTIFALKLPSFLRFPTLLLNLFLLFLSRLLLPLFAFFYSESVMQRHKSHESLIALTNFIVIFLLFSNAYFFQASGQNLLVVALISDILTGLMIFVYNKKNNRYSQFLLIFTVLVILASAAGISFCWKNNQFAQIVNLGQWFNDRFVYLLSTNLPGVVLLTAAASLFFWLGLPVPAALTHNTFTLPAAIGNLNAALDNKVSTVPNVLSLHTLYDAFAVFGGVSMGLALLLLLLINGHRRARKLAGIALLPGLMNSNQILAFGLPVFFNPLLLLPSILAPIAALLISAAALKLNLVNPAVYQLPQRTPSLFVAFLSSGGDWRNLLLVVIDLAVGMLIYLPFVSQWLKGDHDEAD